MMFDGLIQKYIDQFHQKGEEVVKAIVNCKVPSEIVLTKYNSLPPIETLSKEERAEMWEHMRETFPEKSNEELIKAAKIYYTIGTLA